MSRPRVPLADRFQSRVEKTPTCWLWVGYVLRNGYGDIAEGGSHGRHLLVHRLAWELAHGLVPDGMLVCHHCDVRHCVNPSHLFLGTPQDNMVDMVRKGRNRSPRPAPKDRPPICSFEGCDRPRRPRCAFCAAHLRQRQRTGTMKPRRAPRPRRANVAEAAEVAA